jgi:hypothetical protein
MEKKKPELNDMIVGYAILLSPVLYVVVALALKKFAQFQPDPSFFEENPAARAIEYSLYFLGLGVFFFSDFFSRPLKKLCMKKVSGQTEFNPAKFSILMLAVMDFIGLSGFVGYLISGNLAWVMVFCTISFFSMIRFLPSEKHFARFMDDG